MIVDRQWGQYNVLTTVGENVKVKELVVHPGKKLSMQRHRNRYEHWLIAEGVATVYTISGSSSDFELLGIYQKYDSLHINKMQWHQLSNETDQPLKIIEIQYGDECIEEDIERIVI